MITRVGNRFSNNDIKRVQKLKNKSFLENEERKSNSNFAYPVPVFLGNLSPAAITKRWLSSHRIPAYTKIPDGTQIPGGTFKYKQIPLFKKIYSDFESEKSELGIEIIVIDRKKDPILRQMIADFKTEISEAEKNSGKKLSGYDILYKVCKFPTNNYIDTSKPSVELKKMKGQEILLGDIFSSGVQVCRHKAPLKKILLDAVGIKSSVETGFAWSDDHYHHHAWNLALMEDGEFLMEDYPVSIKDSTAGLYLNKDYEKAYPKAGKYFEFADVQPLHSAKLGFDENGNLKKPTKKNKIVPIIKFSWTEDNKFKLEKLAPDITLRLRNDENNSCDFNDIGLRTLELWVADGKNGQFLNIDTKLTQGEYAREILKGKRSILKYHPDPTNFVPDILGIYLQNQKLSLPTLCKVNNNPAFASLEDLLALSS